MAEITGEQVGHEDEVTGLSIASGARLGRVYQPVDRRYQAIARSTIEAVKDAISVVFGVRAIFLKGLVGFEAQFAISHCFEN